MSNNQVQFNNPAFFTGEYTYQWSKYSCSRAFWYVHIIFNYLIFLVGIACFATRLAPPKYKSTHRWLGRAYIIFMLFSTATSMLIHNSGLPLAVLWSFLWVLLFMVIAWVLIVVHMEKMESSAMALVEDEIAKTGPIANLRMRIMRAKGEIARAKTFSQRLFSLKAAHGVLMFTSWINIAGRIFASNVSGDFQCYSYPVYKSIDSKEGNFANQTTPTFIPAEDPNYSRLPWARTGIAGWAVALSVGPIIGAFAFGAVYSYAVSRSVPASSKRSSGANSDDDSKDHNTQAIREI